MPKTPPAFEFDDGSDHDFAPLPWASPEDAIAGEWTASSMAEALDAKALAVPTLGSALESTLTAAAVSSPWAYAHCMALVQWVQHYTPPSDAPLDRVQGWLEAFYHACEADLRTVAVAIATTQTDTGTPLYRQLGQWGHCREQVELCEAMLPHATEPLRGELRQLAGDGQRRLGDYAAARHHYEALLQEGQSTQDLQQSVRANLGLAQILMHFAHYRAAIPKLATLLPEAEALGDAATIVEILQELALAYGYTGRLGRSLPLLNRALDLVKTHGLDDLEVSTLQTLAKVYEWRGQPQQALLYLDRILAVAQTQHNLALEADVYNRLARASFCNGRIAKAIAYSEQSLALYRQLHYVQQELLVLNDIGTFYVYGLGQASTALAYLQRVEPVAQQLGWVNFLAVSIANQAYCHALLGDRELAHQKSQTALTLANQDEMIDGQRMVAYAVLGRVHWAEGRYFTGLALVWQALCIDPPWRSINSQLLLIKTWEALRQWPQHWWQAQFGKQPQTSDRKTVD